ncbi:hypothetical protein BH23ACT2_BH23ACT2_15370 [soil metagenome]
MTAIRCPKSHKVGELEWRDGRLRVRRFVRAGRSPLPPSASWRLRFQHELLDAKALDPWTHVDASQMQVVQFACPRCNRKFSHGVDVLRDAARRGVKQVPAP